MRRAAPADPACPRAAAFQRRSRFDAHEVFPDPARRAESGAAAGAGAHGEIALYGEIERRLRKRGIAEPARDLETLKQILEALQLKGLLHHSPPQPAPVRTAPPPPIVVMRPSSRASQQVQPPARLTPARRLRVDVDRARRPRSPDPSPSPARSPASPARRGPQSPQRRVSPSQSPRQQQQQQAFRRPGAFDSAGARARIARRAAHNAAALSPDDEASTTFSDGGSSSSFSASSRWDSEPQPDSRTDRGLLERCGKLLSSIQAFTGGDAAGTDQQPSPVSVLDAAAFLADEDSPSSSSGSKRAIDFTSSSVVGRPKPPAVSAVSDPEDDEWALASWPTVGPGGCGDPDYAYVAEVVHLFGGPRRRRDPADVYKAAEEQARRGAGGDPDDDTWRQQHRRLLCGAVGEALERQRAACPWEPAAWLRGGELVDHVWARVRRAGETLSPEVAAEDLNEFACSVIRRDMAADAGLWAPTTQQGQKVLSGAEAAEAVLQIERLVFKDLVADTIRELADADRPLPLPLPRRKLVF